MSEDSHVATRDYFNPSLSKKIIIIMLNKDKKTIYIFLLFTFYTKTVDKNEEFPAGM